MIHVVRAVGTCRASTAASTFFSIAGGRRNITGTSFFRLPGSLPSSPAILPPRSINAWISTEASFAVDGLGLRLIAIRLIYIFVIRYLCDIEDISIEYHYFVDCFWVLRPDLGHCEPL